MKPADSRFSALFSSATTKWHSAFYDTEQELDLRRIVPGRLKASQSAGRCFAISMTTPTTHCRQTTWQGKTEVDNLILQKMADVPHPEETDFNPVLCGAVILANTRLIQVDALERGLRYLKAQNIDALPKEVRERLAVGEITPAQQQPLDQLLQVHGALLFADVEKHFPLGEA
jgi:hypothetical protein